MRLRVAELARAGLPAQIGAAATPLLAAYAARCAEPVLLVPDARAFLAPLPLAFAEPSLPQAEILQGWGIRTLGQLTALPKAEVGRRLGTEGVTLWERAAGEATRVLRLVAPPSTFVAEWDYEPPVESVEPLLFRLRRFAERLALELRAAGVVAEKLSLTLLLEDDTDYRREFRLPEPGADVDGWLRVLHAHLETVRTAARVAGVRLAATPARPPAKQDGLFDTGLRDPAAFWENLARLAALVGDDRVGTPGAARHPPAGRVRAAETRRGRPGAGGAARASAPRAASFAASGRRGRRASSGRTTAPPGWRARRHGDRCGPPPDRGGFPATGGSRRRGRSRRGTSNWPAAGSTSWRRTADGWSVEGMLD